MINLVLVFFAALQLGILMWTFRARGADQSGWQLWLIRALLLGMITDNSVQALGAWFIDATWYEPASRLRFILHASILPFLTLFALAVMQRAGITWARHAAFGGFCAVFTLLALAYGLNHDLLNLQLEPKSVLGISKLVDASKVPPIATILTNFLVIILSGFIWRQSGWRWLTLGSLFIFLVNGATATLTWGFIAGNFAEVVFVLSLLFTERRFFVTAAQH